MPKKFLLRSICLLFTWPVSLAAWGGAAPADGAPAESSTPKEDGSRLQEVVVSAQKRIENLQEVPVSVQVVSNQRLAEQNLNSLDALTETVPDVHVATGGFTNFLSIRGVSSGGSATFDQSVAIFSDDIYHGRSRFSSGTFLDLERIEVLKGPQSTFFGNNAIAGAFNIVTKQPGNEFEASARALYGMFGQYAAEGGVTFPVSDTFSVRATAIFDGMRGWIKNLNTDSHAPDTDNKAGRITAVFRPTDGFDATLKLEASKSETEGTPFGLPQQLHNCPPPAPLTPASVGLGGNCVLAIALGPAIVPNNIDNDENSGLPGQGNSHSTFEGVLTVNYNREWGTLTSITGFNNYHYLANIDVGNLPQPLLTQQAPEKYRQFSQEVRFASSAGRPVEYLVGAYAQIDHLDWNATIDAPFLDSLTAIPVFSALIPYLPFSVSEPFSQEEHIYSVFGSLTWNITDKFRATGGLRGSWVNKDLNRALQYGGSTQPYGGFQPLPEEIQPVADALGGLLFGVSGTQSFRQSNKAWMPSAGIQYQIDPQVMAYLSYSRGFLAGGFTGAGSLNPVEDPGYGPEHVNAYELGLKSKWFDNRALLNLDVFRSNYRGLQVTSVISHPETNTYAAETKNAAKSRSEGVELEAQWVIARDFKLGINVTYLDSTYVSFPNASPTTLDGFNGAVTSDLSGQPTQFAPKWSGSLNASYGMLLPRDLRLTLELSPYFTSRYYTASADPFYEVSSYGRLDGRVTLEGSGGHWAIDVIGKNITDRVIVSNPGMPFAAKERPANVAIQFRYRN